MNGLKAHNIDRVWADQEHEQTLRQALKATRQDSAAGLDA